MAVAASAAPTSSAPAPVPLTGERRDLGAALLDALRVRTYSAIGAIKVLGAVEVGTGDVQGSVSIGGRVIAETFRSDGSLGVGADVQVAGAAELRGATRVSGGLSAGTLRASGELAVGGALTVHAEIEMRGDLAVDGALVARSLDFDGTIQAPGAINCPMIQGRLRGPSRIGAIHAQHVRIVRASFPFGQRGALIADRIEATEVELEGVQCEYLRAERITLGARCQVTRVDGEVIRRHRTAVVGPVASEPVPSGLSR